MANNFPCAAQPIRFLNCCQVMDCIDIKSTDNTVTVSKSECGVDLTITGNNLNNLIQINDSECISIQKEFINGKIVFTPVLNFACISAKLENLNPPQVTCPTPVQLVVTVI